MWWVDINLVILIIDGQRTLISNRRDNNKSALIENWTQDLIITSDAFCHWTMRAALHVSYPGPRRRRTRGTENSLLYRLISELITINILKVCSLSLRMLIEIRIAHLWMKRMNDQSVNCKSLGWTNTAAQVKLFLTQRKSEVVSRSHDAYYSI